MGEYDFSSVLEPYPYAERGAKKKVVHPKYNFFTYENDLALVRVDEPLEFLPHIAPICLPPDNESDDLIGRNATVTGWGRLSEGTPKETHSIAMDSHVDPRTAGSDRRSCGRRGRRRAACDLSQS